METMQLQDIQYNRDIFSDDQLRKLYEQIIYPRLIEEKMLILLRQGRISKWFSGIGQEAVAVGVTAALQPEEMVFTLHRNLGVFTTRQVPLTKLFSQWQGKADGFTKGRDRSFHFGAPEYGIVGMISHLGPQLALADGVALANKLMGSGEVAVAFSGEGGTSEGDFHEALNVAAVWDLPVIFVVENNGYGLSTPTSEQFRCSSIADKGIGYGMKSLSIDGNNILEVFETIQNLTAEMKKNPHPVLLECRTFRMRGHEEASGTKYVPKELMEAWAKKDPIANFETFLIQEKVMTADEIAGLRNSLKKQINDDLNTVYDQAPPIADEQRELNDVYAPFDFKLTLPESDASSEKRFVDAISDGLKLAMEKYDKLILMGQDIAEYGGVFKITDGFVEQFGNDRVRNTPICESAIVGAALGLGLKGFKSMMEMQFADFATCGFNQIVNNLAKLHYRWNHPADVVIRMPTGGGVGAGPFHSQSNEAWFAHTPGLKVVYPSNPYDAKGLLLAAFEDPNPVMFFEHKALYRKITAGIPDGYYTVPIGKAVVCQEGREVSIVTYGMGVHWALQVAAEMQIKADIIDLRTLQPLDFETISASVRKTGKVLVLHEDTLTGGIGGEISAYIAENEFEYLDAPVFRVASLDTPVPFAAPLEENFLPLKRLKQQLAALLAY